MIFKRIIQNTNKSWKKTYVFYGGKRMDIKVFSNELIKESFEKMYKISIFYQVDQGLRFIIDIVKSEHFNKKYLLN